MKNPSIKFVIDAGRDVINYVHFNKYSDKKFLKMFLPAELHYINKNFSKSEKEKIIREYVSRNFRIFKKDINKNVKETRAVWNLKKGQYFKLVNKIFKNHPWPKGNYIAFASVFNMYPRNIQKKTFYFSGKNIFKNFNLATLAHEMLHFMFFDYIKSRYGIRENQKLKNKNKKYVWNVSEVFNLVIETWKPYQRIFKTHGRPYDASHTRMLPKMKKIWKKREDVDYLLDNYFKK